MSKVLLNADQIRAILPHRYPILLVDRIVEMSDQHVIAEKLVSGNEPFFQGHFPDRPIMPGVLIIEAIAQAAGVCMMAQSSGRAGMMPALVGIDKARFRRPVVPGDVLELHARLGRVRGNTVKFDGEARVGGELAASANVLAHFLNWERGA
jgi:beta-hydroxyacyl-ACP dehydratase FabZ